MNQWMSEATDSVNGTQVLTDVFDPTVTTWNRKPVWGVYVIFNFTGAFLCLWLVVAIIRMKTKTSSDVFIALICSGCIFMSTTCGWQCLVNLIHDYFWGGLVSCQIEAYFHVSAIPVQFLGVAMLSLRNLFAMRGMDLSLQGWLYPISVRNAWNLSAVTWVICAASVGALQTISPLYLMSGMYCFYSFKSPAIAFMLISLLISILVMVGSYVYIWLMLKRLHSKYGHADLSHSKSPLPTQELQTQARQPITVAVRMESQHSLHSALNNFPGRLGEPELVVACAPPSPAPSAHPGDSQKTAPPAALESRICQGHAPPPTPATQAPVHVIVAPSPSVCDSSQVSIFGSIAAESGICLTSRVAPIHLNTCTPISNRPPFATVIENRPSIATLIENRPPFATLIENRPPFATLIENRPPFAGLIMSPPIPTSLLASEEKTLEQSILQSPRDTLVALTTIKSGVIVSPKTTCPLMVKSNEVKGTESTPVAMTSVSGGISHEQIRAGVIKRLFLFVAIILVCWVSAAVASFFEVFGYIAPTEAVETLGVTGTFHSILVPIAYVLTNGNYREWVRSLFQRFRLTVIQRCGFQTVTQVTAAGPSTGGESGGSKGKSAPRHSQLDSDRQHVSLPVQATMTAPAEIHPVVARPVSAGVASNPAPHRMTAEPSSHLALIRIPPSGEIPMHLPRPKKSPSTRDSRF